MVFIAPSKVLLSATSLSSVSSPAMRLIPIKISIIAPTVLRKRICIKYVATAAKTNRATIAPPVPIRIAFLRRLTFKFLAAIPIIAELSAPNATSSKITLIIIMIS